MSHGKDLLNRKPIKEPLIDNGKQFRQVSLEELRTYASMQDNLLKSRAYILAKKCQISVLDAEEALNLFGDYSKKLYFTEIVLNELKINRVDYLGALKTIREEGLNSLKRQPISLLEQEVMNFQNKFNLDSNERELRLLEKEGFLKPIFISKEGFKVLNDRGFVFNVHNLSYKGDITNSSHYDEHALTMALDSESD